MFAIELKHTITGATLWVEVSQVEQMEAAIEGQPQEYQITDHTFPVQIDARDDFATLVAIAKEIDFWGGEPFRSAAFLCNKDLETTMALLEFRQALLVKH
jgi:hypothetical protein